MIFLSSDFGIDLKVQPYLKGLVLFLLLFFWNYPVQSSQDHVYGSRYLSIRAAGMGNAYLPAGDDIISGLFYNPATLSKINSFRVEPFSISGYGTTEFLKHQNGHFYDVVSLKNYSSILQKAPNTSQGVGGSVHTAIGIPGLFLGALLNADVMARDNGDGTLTYKSLYQLIPTMGTAFRLFNGFIRLGYSFQWVHQTSGNPTLSYASVQGYRNSLSQGSAFSHQLGLMMTLPLRSLPTLSLVARNVGGTRYSQSRMLLSSPETTGLNPSSNPMTVDASFSLLSQAGRGGLLTFVSEYRDLSNQSHIFYLGRLSFGFELGIHQVFFLRGGWRGGYPAGGIGIRTRKSELALAVYTEELGSSYLSQGSTRVMFQYKIRNF